MLIGEVSALLQIPLETLRYYDRIGLVSPSRCGGRRHYSPADVEKLRAVAKMKSLLFSLAEIQAILAADAQVEESLAGAVPDQAAMKTLLAQIRRQRSKVEAIAANIQAVRSELTRLEDKILTALAERP